MTTKAQALEALSDDDLVEAIFDESLIDRVLERAGNGDLLEACRAAGIQLADDLDRDEVLELCDDHNIEVAETSEIDETALDLARRALQAGDGAEALLQLERALLEIDRPTFGRLTAIVERSFSLATGARHGR